MIECIFTIDYEIYGNGEGSLRELVYEPAQKLISVFNRWNARFVSFVEAAEFQMIETAGTDSGIKLVKEQILFDDWSRTVNTLNTIPSSSNRATTKLPFRG